MRNCYQLIFLIGIISLFLSCDDDDTPGPVLPPTIQFGGIHLVDVNGNSLGGGDPTDWNLEDSWEDQVLALFDEERSLCADASAYNAVSAFPNPAQQEVIVPYILKDSADLQLRIVDRDYQLLRSIEVIDVFGPGFNQVSIRLDDLGVTDTVRFYYKLIGTNCELRGHGDVIIE